jgi:hypothetical protein
VCIEAIPHLNELAERSRTGRTAKFLEVKKAE